MIGGLQGEFGDLDIKYLKQKISKCWSQISESFKRNSIALCKMATKFFAAKEQHFRDKRVISQPCKVFLQLGVIGSNGCNFFISTPNHIPFEALDF